MPIEIRHLEDSEDMMFIPPLFSSLIGETNLTRQTVLLTNSGARLLMFCLAVAVRNNWTSRRASTTSLASAWWRERWGWRMPGGPTPVMTPPCLRSRPGPRSSVWSQPNWGRKTGPSWSAAATVWRTRTAAPGELLRAEVWGLASN